MKSLRHLAGMLLLCLVLSSCIANSAINSGDTPDNASLTSQPTVAKVDDQEWDEGEFAGQPVYSLTHGVSQEAHDAFEACGLDDDVIETLVSYYLENGAERQVLMAGEPEGEPLWEVVMNVEPLTPDIFLVSCSGERT